MNAEIKAYADKRDIRQLRYVFAQSLDIDPTFEKYKDDYEYCRKKGIFEPHIDSGFTPLESDKSKWNKSYWASIVTDLKDNLSQKRLDHMRQVAQVIYAEKIKRLRESRQNNSSVAAKTTSVASAQTHVTSTAPSKVDTSQSRASRNAAMREQERKQKEEIETAQRILNEENARYEAEQRRRQQEQNARAENLKKAQGRSSSGYLLVLGIVVIALVGIVMYIMNR